MGTQNIFLIIIIVISMMMNVFIYIKLMKSNDESVYEDSRLEAHMILLERKLSDIKSDMQYIMERLDNIESIQQIDLDETTTLAKKGMSIPEMAKKMNKSIKEVELMLKMRGLV